MLQITISKRAALMLAIAVMLVVPATAVAQSLFNDVDDNSVHAPGIAFMKDSGVTVGCGSGTTYCPDDPVTRAQMATFMHRLSGNAANTEPSVLAASTLDVATAVGGFTTSTQDWVEITSISTEHVIPEGRTARILATFSAESVCQDTDGSCYIRILANGTELSPSNYNPDGRSDIIWDSPEDAASLADTPWESHTAVRVSGELGPGTYTVTVEMNYDEPTTASGQFRLDDMLLATELHFTG